MSATWLVEGKSCRGWGCGGELLPDIEAVGTTVSEEDPALGVL
ncbi:hypothetical protein [Micromonospora craniellae]|nr:hypothetical protein [Micromonospora craniellae]